MKIKIKNKNCSFKIKENEKLEIKGPLGLEKINIKKKLKKKDLNSFIRKIKEKITGVSKGWYKVLNIKGIGYRSVSSFDTLALDLGFSNILIIKHIPEINIMYSKRKIIILGKNKRDVGNFCALLKSLTNKPIYKEKGLILKNEIIKLKKGKIRA